MILQTRNLTLTRPKAAPLHFADFGVTRSDSILLLGPSGCGKTTLLLMLAGLLPPTAGTIQIEGKDFYAMPPQKRDRVRGLNFGFIFQTLHLLLSLSVRQNILLAPKMADVSFDEKRADDLMEALGIGSKSASKPHELSQGERQRVAIARAVFNRPSIIVADEPTSALDDKNTAITMDLIQSQAKENGAALIVATHDHRITDRFKSIIHLPEIMVKAA